MLTEAKTAHIANTYLWKKDELISIQIIIWKGVYFIKKKLPTDVFVNGVFTTEYGLRMHQSEQINSISHTMRCANYSTFIVKQDT